MKKNRIENPVKSLGYIKCYNSSNPRPIKSPMTYKTIGTFVADQEDLKPYWTSEKIYISRGDS